MTTVHHHHGPELDGICEEISRVHLRLDELEARMVTAGDAIPERILEELTEAREIVADLADDVEEAAEELEEHRNGDAGEHDHEGDDGEHHHEEHDQGDELDAGAEHPEGEEVHLEHEEEEHEEEHEEHEEEESSNRHREGRHRAQEPRRRPRGPFGRSRR